MDSPDENENLEQPSRRKRTTRAPEEYSDEPEQESPAPVKRRPRVPDLDEFEAESKPRRRRTKSEDSDSEEAAAPKPSKRRTKAPAESEAAEKPKAPRKTKPEGVTPKKAEAGQKKRPTTPLLPAGPPTLLTRLQQAYRILWIIIRLSPVWGLMLLALLIFGPAAFKSGRIAIVPEAPPISPVFTREVQHWGPQIAKWAAQYNVNPNLVATLMQIESCGFPGAASQVGAQGLFQVMPLNFPEDEQSVMTVPDINAKRGIKVISDCLGWAEGDVGLAMACYNGGPSLIYRDPHSWPQETMNYYTWGGGIYNDAVTGKASSQTLADWLAAGGSGLCQQASAALGLSTPVPGLTPTIAATPLPSIPTFDAGSGGNPAQQNNNPAELPTFDAPTNTPEVQIILTPQQ